MGEQLELPGQGGPVAETGPSGLQPVAMGAGTAPGPPGGDSSLAELEVRPMVFCVLHGVNLT